MTLGVSTTAWWVLGWSIAAAVIVVAAALLLVIIALARKIAGQAKEITVALQASRDNTQILFDLAMTNHALERITRGLNAARGKHTTGWYDRVTSVLGDITGRESPAGTTLDQ